MSNNNQNIFYNAKNKLQNTNRNENVFTKAKKEIKRIDTLIDEKLDSCKKLSVQECKTDSLCEIKKTRKGLKFSKQCIPKLNKKQIKFIYQYKIYDLKKNIFIKFNKYIFNLGKILVQPNIDYILDSSFNKLFYEYLSTYYLDNFKKDCNIDNKNKKNTKSLKKKCNSKDKCVYKKKTCRLKNRYRYSYVNMFMEEFKRDNYKFVTDLLKEFIAENDIRYQMYKNDILILIKNNLKISNSKLNEKIVNILLLNILKHSNIYKNNNITNKSINNNLDNLYEKILNKNIYDKINNLIYFIIDHIQHGILDEKLINIFKHDAAYIKSLTDKGLEMKHISNHMKLEESYNFYSALNKKTKSKKYKLFGRQFGKRNNLIEIFNDPEVGEKITKFINRHKNDKDYDKLLNRIDKLGRINKNILDHLLTLDDKYIKNYLLSNNRPIRKNNKSKLNIESQKNNKNNRNNKSNKNNNNRNVILGGTRNVLNKNSIKTTRHRHTNFVEDIIRYILDIKNEIMNHQAEMLNISKDLIENRNNIINDSMNDMNQLIIDESLNFMNQKINETLNSFNTVFNTIYSNNVTVYDNFNLYIQSINMFSSFIDKVL